MKFHIYCNLNIRKKYPLNLLTYNNFEKNSDGFSNIIKRNNYINVNNLKHIRVDDNNEIFEIDNLLYLKYPINNMSRLLSIMIDKFKSAFVGYYSCNNKTLLMILEYWHFRNYEFPMESPHALLLQRNLLHKYHYPLYEIELLKNTLDKNPDIKRLYFSKENKYIFSNTFYIVDKDCYKEESFYFKQVQLLNICCCYEDFLQKRLLRVNNIYEYDYMYKHNDMYKDDINNINKLFKWYRNQIKHIDYFMDIFPECIDQIFYMLLGYITLYHRIKHNIDKLDGVGNLLINKYNRIYIKIYSIINRFMKNSRFEDFLKKQDYNLYVSNEIIQQIDLPFDCSDIGDLFKWDICTYNFPSKYQNPYYYFYFDSYNISSFVRVLAQLTFSDLKKYNYKDVITWLIEKNIHNWKTMILFYPQDYILTNQYIYADLIKFDHISYCKYLSNRETTSYKDHYEYLNNYSIYEYLVVESGSNGSSDYSLFEKICLDNPDCVKNALEYSIYHRYLIDKIYERMFIEVYKSSTIDTKKYDIYLKCKNMLTDYFK